MVSPAAERSRPRKIESWQATKRCGLLNLQNVTPFNRRFAASRILTKETSPIFHPLRSLFLVVSTTSARNGINSPNQQIKETRVSSMRVISKRKNNRNLRVDFSRRLWLIHHRSRLSLKDQTRSEFANQRQIVQ